MEQSYFNYNIKPNLSIDNFFVSQSNDYAYNVLINQNIKNNKFFLVGPNKSGKTHLSCIWMHKFNAIKYNSNLNEIINNNNNILIEDLSINLYEEDIFHIINHCNLYNLKILITSSQFLHDYSFNLKDLQSRLKTFLDIKIDLPDDELLMNLMIKLLHDKQIIITNPKIFDYILKRVHRSYEKVFLLIDQIDKLLLKENKQLTIPLIKELI